MTMNRFIQTTLMAASLLCPGLLRAEDAPKLETTKDKVSYAIGINIGRNLKSQGVEFNTIPFALGMRDAFSTNTPAMTDSEIQQILMAYQQELRVKQEEIRAKMATTAQEAAKKNREFGAAFLAENGKKVGVTTTASGLQYRILN